MSETKALPASHIYVDSTPDGDVVFSNIAADDLAAISIYMTPACAGRLGQWLIDVAAEVETP